MMGMMALSVSCVGIAEIERRQRCVGGLGEEELVIISSFA
jgi:hypothetical protein